MATYAVVETGSKQYRVSPGETFDVELLPAEPGDRVELERVLLVDNEGQVCVGRPTVPGAKVVTSVVEHGRGKKIIVFKYKSKVRYRRTLGHRQEFTRLKVEEIIPGQAVA